MGGFAGGDEAGFWDDESVYNPLKKESPKSLKRKKEIELNSSGVYSIKSYAKTSVENSAELYDTISFIPCRCEVFTIEGCDDIPLRSNSIYKAYRALSEYTADTDIEEFFSEHKVVVNKNIPLGKGFGGSASNAAAFMCLTKEACNLILREDELFKVASNVNSEVTSFIKL